MKISVIIATYNQSFESIKASLISVINQDFDDFEIIVADDCSMENHFEKIEEFLSDNQFTNYTLISQKENVGTVKNIMNAVRQARGKYIRNIGAGDLMYNKNSLRDIYDFMEENQGEASFGLAKGYFVKDHNIKTFNFPITKYIEAYRKGDYNRIIKNMVLYGNNVYGVCLTIKKEVYLKYLEKLEDVVIYCEDLSEIMYVLDGNKLLFFDKYIVYYESSSGVTNGLFKTFSSRLRNDIVKFYEKTIELYPKNKYVMRRKKLAKIYGIDNLYVRTILLAICNPDVFVYLIGHFLQVKGKKYNPKIDEAGFFSDKSFRKNLYKMEI